MEKYRSLDDIAPITPGNSGGLVYERDPDGSVRIPGISSWANRTSPEGEAALATGDLKRLLREWGIDV